MIARAANSVNGEERDAVLDHSASECTGSGSHGEVRLSANWKEQSRRWVKWSQDRLASRPPRDWILHPSSDYGRICLQTSPKHCWTNALPASYALAGSSGVSYNH